MFQSKCGCILQDNKQKGNETKVNEQQTIHTTGCMEQLNGVILIKLIYTSN